MDDQTIFARLATALDDDWSTKARPEQLPPSGDWWTIWLILAGRGFGKTRAGAEWVRGLAEAATAHRIALVGPTASVSVRKEVESHESDVIQERWPESGGPPMWTSENRTKYDRAKLRYPSDLTDAEWEHIASLIPPAKRGGRKRTVDVREVVNGLMYVLSTGCQWRYVPKDLPPRSTLFDYFDLWTWNGTLDRIHHALYVKCREAMGREASPTACVIDSQSVKSAEKGGVASIRTATTREKNQRQEAPYPRRYRRLVAACDCASRRYSRSRRRQTGAGDNVRIASVSAQALRRWRLSRTEIPGGAEENFAAPGHRDRQAIRSGAGFRSHSAQMGGRAHLRLAREMPQAGEGLRKPDAKRLGVYPPGIDTPDGQKTGDVPPDVE